MTDDTKFYSNKKAIFAYITVCILWGSTYLATKIGVGYLPPLLFGGIRFTIAGLIMFGYAYIRRLPLPGKIQIRNQSILGLILLFGANGMILLSSQLLSAGIVSLFFATSPLFTAIGETFLPKGEKLPPAGWAGLLIGFGGVAFLILGGQQSLNISLKGTAMTLFGSMLWALGFICTKRLKSEGSMEFDLSIQMISGGLPLILVGSALGEWGTMTMTKPGILAMTYLVIFGSLLGYNAFIYLLRVWPVTSVSTYTYVNPFVAIFLGFLILKEPLTIHVFIGTGIIMFGVFMVQFSKKNKTVEDVKE